MIRDRLADALRRTLLRPTDLRLVMPAKTERSRESLHEARAAVFARVFETQRAQFPERHPTPDETRCPRPDCPANQDPFRLDPAVRVRRINSRAFHIDLAADPRRAAVLPAPRVAAPGPDDLPGGDA